jgi:deoxyuridine 5'-triphosphate nucleotidohydrolase
MDWNKILEIFETHGYINNNPDNLFCYIQHTERSVLENIANFSEIPSYINSFFGDAYTLFYRDTNCIDFLGHVFKGYKKKEIEIDKIKLEGFKVQHNLDQEYYQYVGLLQEVRRDSFILPKCEIFCTDEKAIVPSKSKVSDAGYDLTIIKEHKRLNNKTVMYDTGVKIKVPHGFYAEVVPRSSLSKSGYMLANSIGIIDASYRGNIYIALTKVNHDSPDIQLPFRCCQIIFRKQIHMEMSVVNEDFAETARGSGGFGSTGGGGA